MIKEDNDISAVMKFCGNLLFQEEDDESDYDDDEFSVDSELTFDFEAFCKKMSFQEDNTRDSQKKAARMTFMDKATMATVGGQFSHGSVEVARGKRMTIMPSKNKKEERRKTIMKEVKRRQTKLARKRTLIAHRSSMVRSSMTLTPEVIEQATRSQAKPNRETFIFGHVMIRGTSGEF